MSDGLAKLIDPWMMVVPVDGGERTQHFPPLVDMLRARVVPDGNQNGGGSAVNTRNVLDVKSLDLLEHIQNVTRAWLQEWRVTVAGELKLDLRGFWDHLHTLHRTEEIDQYMYERLAAYPDAWATSIWDLIEPPIRVSLRGLECTRCGNGKFTNENGDTVDNLIVVWRDGQEPTAECQVRECAAIWVSDTGLEELGNEAGLDIDIVALREARLARHAK
ncbi:hypothetical protein [Microbacterium sp. LWH11-1.2]|uniref:DUF7341 domain-containing protein n=1 Tax=Microbacterium sp. LWH11-1.2 TaxID=3135258 RepID=UPI003138A4F2